MSNRVYQRIYGKCIDFQYMRRLHGKDNNPDDIRTQNEIPRFLNRSEHHFNSQGNMVGNAVCIIRTPMREDELTDVDSSVGIHRRNRIPNCDRIWFWTMGGRKYKIEVKRGSQADRAHHGKFESETYCFWDREHQYFGL